MASSQESRAAAEQAARRKVASANLTVIKIGSSLLTDPESGTAHGRIRQWCGEIVAELNRGRRMLLVSSGAVAEGVARLGWRRPPPDLPNLQAAAAVGQMGLVGTYESAFAEHGRHTALVLLTHEDLADRHRYLNARTTLNRLLDLGVVPVVNENDTVATDEIRFGDNDTLAALVASLLAADALILLTDVDGVHNADPRRHPQAAHIAYAEAGDPSLDAGAGSGGELGRGGMVTKIEAARMAARSGAHTLIADGRRPSVLRDVFGGRPVGTLLAAGVGPLVARKRWIAGQQRPKGELVLDAGAAQALRERGVSLLPVGVAAVRGEFNRGALVRCVNAAGELIAQGLVNYSSAEAIKICGAASGDIHSRLGYVVEPELVHRDNLVLV